MSSTSITTPTSDRSAKWTVYRSFESKAQADAGSLVGLAERIFDIGDSFVISEDRGRLSLRCGVQVVEQESASGGVWAADHGRWFNPSVRPELPDFERAVSIADELGRGRRLLPELSGDFSFGAAHVAGTHLAIREQGRRSEHQLDVQVVYPVQVAGLPVVGGGGDFTFALGDGGDLIGFSGVWREAEGAFDAAMLPRDQSDEAHKALFASAKGLELESVESYLAYYAAPTFTVQEFLYPVYVYLATARIGERSVPLRAVMLPATDFGPRVVLPPLAPARPKRSRPAALPSAEERPRRSYEYGKPRPRALFAATKPWEAGTSWIGTSGG